MKYIVVIIAALALLLTAACTVEQKNIPGQKLNQTVPEILDLSEQNVPANPEREFIALQGRYFEIKREMKLIWYSDRQTYSELQGMKGKACCSVNSRIELVKEVRSRKQELYLIYKTMVQYQSAPGMEDRYEDVVLGVKSLILALDTFEKQIMDKNQEAFLFNHEWIVSDAYDQKAMYDLLYYWNFESQ